MRNRRASWPAGTKLAANLVNAFAPWCGTHPKLSLRYAVLAIALAGVAACAASAGRDDVPALSAPVSLKVAAVQFRSSATVEENAARMVEILTRLAADGVRVAVFPEAALTSYDQAAFMKVTPEELAAGEERIRQACREGRIAAVFGSAYKVNGRIYNTAVVFDSRGELIDRYGKLYLANEKWFTPGNHISFFELEGVPSTVMICADEIHPELVRLPAMQGARVVYYISHESGLKLEYKLAPYRAQLMARALENRVFIVGSNAPANQDLSGSHGQSRIVGPDGNVIKEATFFGEEILVDTLEIKPGRMQRPLKELYGPWWQQGIETMLANRRKPLD